MRQCVKFIIKMNKNSRKSLVFFIFCLHLQLLHMADRFDNLFAVVKEQTDYLYLKPHKRWLKP